MARILSNFQEPTQDEIPAKVEKIPAPEIVGIEHLKVIASEISAYDPKLEISLLTGSNCPNALVLLSVVLNEGDGPFALRLKHGWTVSGPLQLRTEPFTNKVTANRITAREVESANCGLQRPFKNCKNKVNVVVVKC